MLYGLSFHSMFYFCISLSGNVFSAGDMDIKPGDRVVFLNESGGGVVLRVNAEVAVVEDENGFELPYPLSELIPENRDAGNLYHKADIRPFADKDLPVSKVKSSKVQQQEELAFEAKIEGDFMEIDLHIHELIQASRHLSNSEMIAIQMDHFYRAMEVAVAKKLRKVVFIHGVGKGVLRTEIRRELGCYPNCRFYDASYTEYGYGATEVILWFN